MPDDSNAAWKRVGDLLVRRRIELDPRYRNRRLFTAERGVDYRMVNAIERGERSNYEAVTLSALEVAYGLTPGAIRRAVDGADLEALPPLADAAPGPDSEGPYLPPRDRKLGPLHGNGIDEDTLTPYVAEVQALLLGAITRTGNTEPPGKEIFADAAEAEWWDGASRVMSSGRRLLDQHERVRRTAVTRMGAARRREASLGNGPLTECWNPAGRALMDEGEETADSGM